MAESKIPVDIAKIKAARDAKGWTQEELAKRAGYSISVIQKLEQGAYDSVQCLKNCASALGVQVADLLVSSDSARAQRPLTLTPPDPDAAKVVRRANEDRLVIGTTIEWLPHPNLDTSAEIRELGWNPAQVSVEDRQQLFDATAILERTGGYKEFDPPNGKKFCLSDTSFVTQDSPELVVYLTRTNYFTIKTVLPAIQAQPTLREELGALDPRCNRIPHSLCLHYLIRFANGAVLCAKRHHKIAYHPNRWSFSGEEQFSESDLASDRPVETSFQRSFCEEVFPLRDPNPATLPDRWALVRDTVEYMRLFSILLEEPIWNYSFFGLYQLRIGPVEYVAKFRELFAQGRGSRDQEGHLFIVTEDSLKDLFLTGNCMCQPAFGGEEETIQVSQLHPTSIYRIYRLLRGIARRPLDEEWVNRAKQSRRSSSV